MIISDGNAKLGRIPNISLLPGPAQSCGKNAKHCIGRCYAVKFVSMYKHVQKAWEKNTEIVNECDRTGDYDPVIIPIVDYIYTRGPRHFRIHVSGDFTTQGYFNAWKEIADICPDTHFLAYTKREDIDFADRPSNLAIRASQWPTMHVIHPTLPAFWATPDPRVPDTAFPCPDDCSSCKACWDNKTLNIVNPIH